MILVRRALPQHLGSWEGGAQGGGGGTIFCQYPARVVARKRVLVVVCGMQVPPCSMKCRTPSFAIRAAGPPYDEFVVDERFSLSAQTFSIFFPENGKVSPQTLMQISPPKKENINGRSVTFRLRVVTYFCAE